MDGLSTLQEKIEAASRRIDRSTSEMLTVLEDEMAEGDYEALEHAARARVEGFVSDDSR
jgi:hypothetical protein